MSFEIIGELSGVEIIATGSSIRDLERAGRKSKENAIWTTHDAARQ